MSISPNELPFLLNEQSFTVLFNKYWERMYAICYHNSRNIEASQGMIQDIFRSLWEKRETFKITGSVEHYLLRAAKLKACDYIRDQVQKEKHLVAITGDSCGGAHCTEEAVLYNELTSHVNMLIDRLSCQCRKVYQMSLHQGLSNKEIASALLISEKTVSYHLVKAKDTLKYELANVYQEKNIL